MTQSFWTKLARFWDGDLTLLGVPPLDDYAAGRVRVEQINTVIRYTQAMMIANIVNGVVLVAALWTSAQSTLLMVWLLSLIVFCMAIYLRRTQRPHKKTPDDHFCSGDAFVLDLWRAIGINLGASATLVLCPILNPWPDCYHLSHFRDDL